MQSTVRKHGPASPGLDDLVAKFGGRWDITRRIDCTGTPGAWYAVRRDRGPALQRLRTSTASDLWAALRVTEAGR